MTLSSSLLSLSLRRKVIILIAVPLLCELLFVCALVYSQKRLEAVVREEIRAKELVVAVNYSLSLLMRAGAFGVLERTAIMDKLRGQLGMASRWQSARQQFRKDRLILRGSRVATMNDVFESWLKVRGLVGEDEYLKTKVAEISRLVEEIAEDFAAMDSAGSASSMSEQLAGFRVYSRIRKVLPLVDRVIEYQDRVQTEKSNQQERERRSIQTVVVIGVVSNIAIAILLAIFIVRTTLSRLAVVVANSQRFADNAELLPPVSGSDEISALDRDFRKMARKVTDAHRRESAIIANSMDVIFSLDANFKFTLISNASERLWGYPPGRLEGQSVACVLPSEFFPEVKEKLSELDSESPLLALECRILHKDGHQLHTLWSICRSAADNAYFCVSHDISERKQVEQLRRDFLSMVSHDLRTPLTSISMTYGLLKKGSIGELTERGKQLVEGGDTTVKRLVKLISDLIEVEKTEQINLSADRRQTTTTVLLDKALATLSPLADSLNIELVARDPALGCECELDRIVQVLVNLLGNSLKFSPPGSRIEISVKQLGDCLEFSVLDQGRGIPQEKLEAIFERFAQVEEGDRAVYGGTGLGLFICKLIVRSHGGDIGVDSRVGQGSRFWFTLPQRAPESLTL